MTTRQPREALKTQKGKIKKIKRHEKRKISDENSGQEKNREAEEHGNDDYIDGNTNNEIDGDIKTQTAQVLRRVDELLNLAGTDKSDY